MGTGTLAPLNSRLLATSGSHPPLCQFLNQIQEKSELALIRPLFRANRYRGSFQFSVFSFQCSVGENAWVPRAACRPCESDSGGQAASGTRKSRPIGARLLGGFGWVQIGKRVLHNFAHSRTCLHKPTQFRHMPAQARTCRHIPARPWNRRRRRASHCVNDTYIAGYALLSLFGADVRPAWAACRQGIEVKRLVHRRELAEETGVSRKTGRQRDSPTGWRLYPAYSVCRPLVTAHGVWAAKNAAPKEGKQVWAIGAILVPITLDDPTAKRLNSIAQGKRTPPWVGGWGRILNPERAPQPSVQPFQG